jgi:hypothetical protein
MKLLEMLSGKKTILGSLLVSLLSAMYFLDMMIHGSAMWLTEQEYISLGGVVAGLTGISMRLAIGKSS